MCGIDGTYLMLMVSQLTLGIDGRYQKCEVHRVNACQEIVWLREELKSARIKLQQSEQMIAQLEEENKHLKYMASIKQFDDETASLDSEKQPLINTTLGFGPEDEEDLNDSTFAPPSFEALVASKKTMFTDQELVNILRFVLKKIRKTGTYGDLMMTSKAFWLDYNKYNASSNAFPQRPTTSLTNKWRYSLLNGDVICTLPVGKYEMLDAFEKLPIQITEEVKNILEKRFAVRISLKDGKMFKWEENEEN
ncbi:unnamed protein product [Caenorhabditis brenneri]